MERPGKGLTTSLDLLNRRPNKKQQSEFSINYITDQYLSKFLKKFESLPYLAYKSEQVHIEETKA